MKKIVIFILGLLPLILFSQEKNSNSRDEIETKRIAFITSEVGITPDEATKFWPLYNEYNREMRKVLSSGRHSLKKMHDIVETTNISSEELEKLVNDYGESKEKVAKLEADYLKDLKKVLSLEKIGRLLVAEEEFRENLIHMWRKTEGEPRRGRK